jgi:hypothetical protein
VRPSQRIRSKPELTMRVADTLELQLKCRCCGQPYYPNKAWEDKLQAVFLGSERFAICPVCTQAPPEHVFNDHAYRQRCLREVRRLQNLYEKSQRQKTKVQR